MIQMDDQYAIVKIIYIPATDFTCDLALKIANPKSPIFIRPLLLSIKTLSHFKSL